jgi:hypothetical protein
VPEIDIERRERTGMPAWVWLIAALLIGLMIWGLWSAMTNNRRATTPASRVAGERQVTRDNASGMQNLPLAAMTERPSDYFSTDVRGAATVTEVVSDRGFWVESGGQRAFVTLGEGITEPDVNVNAGQRVAITGRFLEANQTNMGQLEPQVQQSVKSQPGFIQANSVDVLQPGTK